MHAGEGRRREFTAGGPSNPRRCWLLRARCQLCLRHGLQRASLAETNRAPAPRRTRQRLAGELSPQDRLAPALDPTVWVLEPRQCGLRRVRARELRAAVVAQQGETAHAPHAESVQALWEEPVLSQPFPLDVVHAEVLLLKECLCGMLGQDLQRAEHGPRLLTIQHVEAGAVWRTLAQVGAQAERKEDRVRLDLHRPVTLLKETVAGHRTPYAQEALVAMSGRPKPPLRRRDARAQAPRVRLGRRDQAGGLGAAVAAEAEEHLLAIGEHGVLVAVKDAGMAHKMGLDQLDVPVEITQDGHAEERDGATAGNPAGDIQGCRRGHRAHSARRGDRCARDGGSRARSGGGGARG
mmetsp:Transcript_57354/g.153647  ORF Transcript_57354/g.153647 Transcript_57354/m.153647 type:complete len:351 (+) Transcript_57354:2-1054(+)